MPEKPRIHKLFNNILGHGNKSYFLIQELKRIQQKQPKQTSRRAAAASSLTQEKEEKWIPEIFLALPQHKVPLALGEPRRMQSQGRGEPGGLVYVATDTARLSG